MGTARPTRPGAPAAPAGRRPSRWSPAAGQPCARRSGCPSGRPRHAPPEPGDDAAPGLRPARRTRRPRRPWSRCTRRSRSSRWRRRRSRSSRWRSWWSPRGSRWPWWPRWHAGCLRARRWPRPSWSQVEASASSRVRPDAGAGDRWRPRPSGRRLDRPARPRRLADGPVREDQRRRVEPGPGAVQPGRDGHRHADGGRGHARGAGDRAQLQDRDRLSRGRGPRAPRELRHRVRRERGWRGRPRGPPAGRHRHGSRRPRQDEAPRRDPQDQRGRRRGRWHHAGHRCVPGRHRGGRPGAQDHLHRHPGSRGVHRHACPWCEVDRHRRARRGGGRRRDAADHRGAQPRPRCGRPDRGRGQQDRPRGCGPDQGARPAHRVRPGARGVRRRDDVRRRLRDHRRRPGRSCSRRSS